ncbi:MAG: tryptophan--tRNA ligase [Patescibacteria group bacterium]
MCYYLGMSKTILSGLKPTGRPHMGNYFGMMRQLINLQSEGQVFGIIVDYHALNFIQNAGEMRDLTREIAIDYLALGFNTDKNILFKQSDVSEHTELAWIFDTITTVPYLKRAHAYKDAVAKGGEEDVSAGTFTYPMLMAADILLYDTDIVPVGQDQKQHIEFARDTAEKFNRVFGETFKLPEAYIIKDVETVPGIDGRKMSKSYNNTISLFAEDKEIEEKVMAIVTDSSGERPENVYAIHKLLVGQNGSTSFDNSQDKSLTIDKLEKVYQENKGQYKVLKEMLIEDLINFIRPMRERREEIAKDLDFVNKVLEEGKEKARAVASRKMSEVKKAIGVN